MESHPGGISTEQFLHYMQVLHSSTFRQYDFGFFGNYLRYNRTVPPLYPIENITKLIHIWYGQGDHTVKPADIQRFARVMPAVELHCIPDRLWSHGDFMFSLNVRQLFNEPLIGILNDYEVNKSKIF